MKKNIENYDVFKETISQNNVLAMAEQLAMYETRFLIGYMGSKMQKIYADLCVDIRRKNDIDHTYSDSYDLVQECALFLCNHYGKRLNDVFAYDKKGKAITVKIACVRAMSKLITRKTSDYYRSVSLDALTLLSEPSCEIEEDVAKDYTVYDSIVDSLIASLIHFFCISVAFLSIIYTILTSAFTMRCPSDCILFYSCRKCDSFQSSSNSFSLKAHLQAYREAACFDAISRKFYHNNTVIFH